MGDGSCSGVAVEGHGGAKWIFVCMRVYVHKRLESRDSFHRQVVGNYGAGSGETGVQTHPFWEKHTVVPGKYLLHKYALEALVQRLT